MNFHKLTPKRDVDVSGYEEALDFVFSNDDIRNIAVSGAYSSGKSSVMESYREKHNKNFISISLAHFGDEKTESDNEKNNLEKTLEGKILNQLAQQIPVEKIPLSGLNIKKSDQSNFPKYFSAGCILFVACILYTIFFDNWCTYAESVNTPVIQCFFYLSTFPVFRAISGVIAMVLSGKFLYKLCQVQYDKRIFSKINFQGNVVELFSEKENSYFDRYLNEVIYLFEKAEFDGIIFEDIDRFDHIEVFERLREINLLVNARLRNKKSETKVVRFFYLLRDDVFQSKDRAKFFDYILPIVPVLDSSNSYDKIKEYLTEDGLYEKFNDYFLQGVSLYIDDLRILNNVYNEFIIYNIKLNTIELDLNKLFAIIIYKNLFPQDFADLQLNRGFIYSLFGNKEILRKDLLSRFEAEYMDIEEKIDECEKEHLKNTKELEIISNKKYDKTNANSNLMPEYQSWLDTEYKKRFEVIERRSSGELDHLKNRKKELDELRVSIENYSLKQLLDKTDIDKVFSMENSGTNENCNHQFREVKENPYFGLLKYLLSRGYIDETYFDYMGFFYDNSISVNDKVFLRSIAERRMKVFDYKLDSPKLVAEKLEPSEFQYESILNYALVDFILNHSNEASISVFVKQLERDERFDYISGYLESNYDSKQLAVAINHYWPEAFGRMLDSGKVEENLLKEYSYLTVQYSSGIDLENCNVNGCLSQYISSDCEYVSVSSADCSKLISGFKVLDIKFEEIKYQTANMAIFDQVYLENMYIINAGNIALMLEVKCGIRNANEILGSLCTMILSGEDEPLYQYLCDNMGESLEVYLNLYKEKIDDSSDVIKQILNHQDVSENTKMQYICQLNNVVDDISSIEEPDIRNELITRKRIDYNANNIIYLFTEYGLNEELTEFINSYDLDLDYCNEVDDEGMKNDFLNSILVSTELLNKKYRQIVRNLCYKMECFGIPSLPEKQVEILIEEDLIIMNLENLNFMRQNYPECNDKFIIKNIEKYTELVSEISVNREELLMVLSCEDISDKDKIELIQCYNNPISIIGKNYSETLTGYILSINLDFGDIPELLKRYEHESETIKGILWKIFCRNVQRVIEHADCIEQRTRNSFFVEDGISINDKVDLFCKSILHMSETDIYNVLKTLHADKIVDNLTGGSKRVEINDINIKILDALKEANIIDPYEEARDGEHYKKIRKRKKQQKSSISDRLL
ncbi:MAG: hypothetical protein ACLVMI_02020 [Clostridia bacterium]